MTQTSREIEEAAWAEKSVFSRLVPDGVRTIVLLGKGDTRGDVVREIDADPRAAIWTLNRLTAEGLDPDLGGIGPHGSTAHFDVHHDRRNADHERFLKPECPIVTAPFRPAVSGREIPFPICAVSLIFGRAYFESTACMMLALAALVADRRQWDQAAKVRRVALCGLDMGDSGHWSARAGASYWIGRLEGLRVQVHVPEESALMKPSRPPRTFEDPRDDHSGDNFAAYPHCYGTPGDITRPLSDVFGWNPQAGLPVVRRR